MTWYAGGEYEETGRVEEEAEERGGNDRPEASWNEQDRRIRCKIVARNENAASNAAA